MALSNITVRKNERSWAIEIISQINLFADKYDIIIKRAGGESTISSGNGSTMFPDVILYGNKELTKILQGWELKMPDIPITDETFVQDAQRKAIALNLSSFIIWNFTYVKFAVLDESTKSFRVVQQWENLHIKTRDDVATYRDDWAKTLEDVILCISDYLITNKTHTVFIGDVISKCAINMLINTYKDSVADYYKKLGISYAIIEAVIDEWWRKTKSEYLFDENNKYKAYAKTIMLNWAYRIIFAHLIKSRHYTASLVNDIDYTTKPSDANVIFRKITEKCDFYNIFDAPAFNELLPEDAWTAMIELSLFLKVNGIKCVDQSILQNILESCVNTTRRELNGQFTTPKILARILACITIRNWEDNIADTCCGTGTIPHEIIEIKKSKIGTSAAIETTWASDKYKMPLQIANFSMTSYDTMNQANRLFQKNVLDLKVGDVIDIVNPQDGKLMNLSIPYFGAICSNLPFLSFENIPDDDKLYIENIRKQTMLDGKSDLSFYLTIHLAELLKNRGYLGIITSNSWLGTAAGHNFYRALHERYHLKQVHISGNGRWFENADVVTTILILQKKDKETDDGSTSFFVWEKDLKTIAREKELERQIINSSLLDRTDDDSVIKRVAYEYEEIERLHKYNLSYNALFHNVRWLLDIKELLIPLDTLFEVIRGNRRGWDKLFFPNDKNRIEGKFILKALFNAKNLKSLYANPDRDAFCCSETLDNLRNRYPGAYEWVKKFECQKNNTGKPLPDVLAKANEKWYEMKANEVVEIFTMMNPNDRIFFGRFKKPAFINQRLIGFKLRNQSSDINLYHALLNSILMKFFVEAVGFGRGLGVLDISKESIAKCFILNPALLENKAKQEIIAEFKKVATLNILTVEEELSNNDWISFNKEVLKAYGIEEYYDKISQSLVSMRQARSTAVKKVSHATTITHIGKKYKEFEGFNTTQKVAEY